jgi:Flp pilus assembly protein TadD
LAVTYLGAKKNDAAIATLGNAALDPQNPDLQILLAGAWSNSGELKKSAEILTKAKAAFPPNAQIHLGLGTLHEIEGRFDQAISEYQEALRLNPKSAEIESRLLGARRRLAERRQPQ